jgi:peptidoglycan/xylan/chitin deacetylase (PgdA/CDA1 family)
LPATPTPIPATAARIVYRGDASRRMVALTFDAGADTGFAADILETLRREGIRASFGMTGLWAERNIDLVNAMAADGHEFINHTYDHQSFTGFSTDRPPLTSEERSLELQRAETTIYHNTSRTTRPLFRPPYGDIDPSVARDVAADGYDTIVMWTVDTLGWKGASADAIVQTSLATAEPGAIYVMHVGAQSQDAAALPRVIAVLRAAGYSFGTVTDVIGGG